MSAAVVWWVTIGLIAGTVVGNLLADLVLWSVGMQTETDYLQLHPDYFRWPAIAVVLLLVVLTVHLIYVRNE